MESLFALALIVVFFVTLWAIAGGLGRIARELEVSNRREAARFNRDFGHENPSAVYPDADKRSAPRPVR